jgi:hypothetical protein
MRTERTLGRKVLWTLLLLMAGVFLLSYNRKASIVARTMGAVQRYALPESSPRPGAFMAPRNPASWQKAMAECAKPGPNVNAFVNSFHGSPTAKMAQAYAFIAKKWHYSADEGHDWLSNAEDLLRQPDGVSADCKSIAVVLSACARELGVDSRIVATRGSGKHPGHVQTQIQLAGPNQDPIPVIARMARIWGAPGAVSSTLPLLQLESGTWLVLDGGLPPRTIKNLGAVEVVINNWDNNEE